MTHVSASQRRLMGFVILTLVAFFAARADALVPLGSYPGTDIWTDGGYRYGPTIFMDSTGQTIQMWCASEGNGSTEWDWIRYKKSTDGGNTWTAEQVVLKPTPSGVDHYSVCDPGVFKYGSYYYCGYTSTAQADGNYNHVFVARSTSPTGPWDKWNGSGWGGNPQPFIVYSGNPAWGCGEPSFVVLNGTIYIYYTYTSDTVNQTRVATAVASNANWPGALTYHGTALTRGSGEASTDIKYVDGVNKFIGIAERNRLTASSYLVFYESTDGITFTQAGQLSDNIGSYCHNSGLSAREDGHMVLSDKNFVAYAHGPNWGQWDLERNYISFRDLFVIQKSGTGTGSTEVHSLSGLNNFQYWTIHSGSGCGPTDSNYQMLIGDWNADKKMDLFVVTKQGTSATDVHIWDGNNYNTALAHIATGLGKTDANWQFDLGNWDNDNKPDLFCINRQGTTMTDVHILSGASNYATFIGHYATALGKTDANWDFAVADWNNDGKADLFCINRQGTTMTDIHILNGATNFSTYLASISTGLAKTDSSWSFDVGDWNGDLFPDVVAIHRDGALGTEVKILNGITNLSSFVLDTPTALGAVGTNYEFTVNFIDN